MVVAIGIPSPASSNRGTAINPARVARGMPVVDEVVAPGHPVAGRLVACCKHTERGMVAIGSHHALSLLKQITVYGHATAQLYTMVGPRRSLWLQIQSHLVGSAEGSLGRTIGVEAHMVDAIAFAFAEDVKPRRLVGRRIARLREAAVLYGSTQPYRVAVEI